MRKLIVILALIFLGSTSYAGMLLIPMDEAQQNHIKSYGIAYWVLEQKLPIEWLLNYRGGSFLFADTAETRKECVVRGVTFELLSDLKTEFSGKYIFIPE